MNFPRHPSPPFPPLKGGRFTRQIHGRLTCQIHGGLTRQIHGGLTRRIHGGLTRRIYGGLTRRIYGGLTRRIYGGLTCQIYGGLTCQIHGGLTRRIYGGLTCQTYGRVTRLRRRRRQPGVKERVISLTDCIHVSSFTMMILAFQGIYVFFLSKSAGNDKNIDIIFNFIVSDSR
jgi:hypothetical protein